MERARLLIGLATRSSIVLPAVCSCVSVLEDAVAVVVLRARLLTREEHGCLPAVCAVCQRAFLRLSERDFLQHLMQHYQLA